MMRHKLALIGLTMFIFIGLAYAAELRTGDAAYFSCNNATSGELLCTSATIACNASTDTLAVSRALTNTATGVFRHTFANTTGRYSCLIDCCAGAVDYYVPIYLNHDAVISAAVNASSLTVGTNNDKTGYTASTVSDKTGYSLAAGQKVDLNNNAVNATTVSVQTRVGLITDAVNTTTVATGAIDADAIAADAIGASEIAANAIGASELADNAIDAGAIAADAITSSELAASAVTKIQSGLCLYPQAAEINNSVYAIRNTDVVSITGNQDTINNNLGIVSTDVNQTRTHLSIVSTVTNTTLGHLNLMSSTLNLTPQSVWAYATRTLSSFGSLVTDIDTQLNLSHSTGNWSAVDGPASASISDQDKQDIANITAKYYVWNNSIISEASRTVTASVTANVNATQIWTENLTGYCSINSTNWPDTAGEMLACIYNGV